MLVRRAGWSLAVLPNSKARELTTAYAERRKSKKGIRYRGV